MFSLPEKCVYTLFQIPVNRFLEKYFNLFSIGSSYSVYNSDTFFCVVDYATWQQITGDRQDDAYLNPADTGHRDSQGKAVIARYKIRMLT